MAKKRHIFTLKTKLPDAQWRSIAPPPPVFDRQMNFGSATVVASDVNGKLWRIDPDAGTVTEVILR